MNNATLMVNLELGRSNAGLLHLTNYLAGQLDAEVIGVAARQPMQIIYADGGYVSPDIVQGERDEIEKEMRAAEAELRTLVERPGVLWRASVGFEAPADYVARQARRADLLLTGIPVRDRLDATRVSTSDLVMQAGRPVLVAPDGFSGGTLSRVVMGWKDSRESRRAALDALPLLRLASHVIVAEIAVEAELAQAQQRLQDVAAWLAGHGVAAEMLAHPAEDDGGSGLAALAAQHGADLVVAGAYGHSRVREWALGGATRQILQHAKCCALLSH